MPASVLVVASEDQIAPLRLGAAQDAYGAARLLALGSSEAIPDDILHDAVVLVLEVRPDDRASLRRIAQVRALRPDLPVIAAVHEASLALARTLVRQGVNDVAVLPFDRDELMGQILDAAASHGESAAPLGRLTCVVRSTGGCGATTVLTHLAQTMAEGGTSTCVVDLDLQNASVASYLGLPVPRAVTDLLEIGEGLDRDVVRTATTDGRGGFSVIPGPDAVTPLETVEPGALTALLKVVRGQYQDVLADLPATWTNWSLSVALAADRVVIVTDLSIAGLRQARRRIDLMRLVGVKGDNIGIAVNRVERRLFQTVSVREVTDTLGCEVLGTLYHEGGAITAAQDQGLLLTEVSPRSRFVGDIRQLAARIRS